VSTQQADVCPKHFNVSFFVELMVKFNIKTKLANRMKIQGLFNSFSLVRDQNDNELHIEDHNDYIPKKVLFCLSCHISSMAQHNQLPNTLIDKIKSKL
jgi:hypothetical protein